MGADVVNEERSDWVNSCLVHIFQSLANCTTNSDTYSSLKLCMCRALVFMGRPSCARLTIACRNDLVNPVR